MLLPLVSQKGTAITAAAAILIPSDGLHFDVNGATGISTIQTNGRAIGTRFFLRFTSACPVTNNTSSLILFGRANAEIYSTVPGEWIEFEVIGTNQVREVKSRFTPLPVSSISTTQTLAYVNRHIVTTGSITITLPTPVGRAGEEVWITKGDASTNLLIATGVGNLGGRSSIKLQAQYSSVGLRSNGANWDVLAHNATGAALFAYASTVTPDAAFFPAIGGAIEVGLTGNVTIATPLNPIDGQELTFILVQGGSGGYIVTWNAAFGFNTTFPSPTLSTAAGKIDEIKFKYRAAGTKWICIGQALGS